MVLFQSYLSAGYYGILVLPWKAQIWHGSDCGFSFLWYNYWFLFPFWPVFWIILPAVLSILGVLFIISGFHSHKNVFKEQKKEISNILEGEKTYWKFSQAIFWTLFCEVSQCWSFRQNFRCCMYQGLENLLYQLIQNCIYWFDLGLVCGPPVVT